MLDPVEPCPGGWLDDVLWEIRIHGCNVKTLIERGITQLDIGIDEPRWLDEDVSACSKLELAGEGDIEMESKLRVGLIIALATG